MKKPTVADYVGIRSWKPQLSFKEQCSLIKQLKSVIKTITDMECNTDDPDAIIDMVSDLAWELSALNTAVDVVENYSDIGVEIGKWEQEVRNRFTDDEEQDFRQMLTMHKLASEE